MKYGEYSQNERGGGARRINIAATVDGQKSCIRIAVYATDDKGSRDVGRGNPARDGFRATECERSGERYWLPLPTLVHSDRAARGKKNPVDDPPNQRRAPRAHLFPKAALLPSTTSTGCLTPCICPPCFWRRPCLPSAIRPVSDRHVIPFAPQDECGKPRCSPPGLR